MMTKHHFGTSHVPLSPAVRAGDFIYISGQVPVGSDGTVIIGGIEAQTKQVMDNVQSALALAGAELSDVVKTFVILEDARESPRSTRPMPPIFPKTRRRGRPLNRA